MMKRVGVTMRFDPTPHGEWRDALDSAWPQLINSLGFIPVLLPCKGVDGAEAVEIYGLDAIILTGGNDVMPDGSTYSRARNDFELSLMESASRVPVVGICRGMQMMNLHGGGTVKSVDGHVRINHAVTWSGKTCMVNSYHNYSVNVLAHDLIITGQAEDGSIEAVKHKSFPWQAIMWHPEREIDDAAFHHDWLRTTLNGGKK